MIVEKVIIESYAELKTWLTNKGFTISNNEMRWGAANQDTNCHWEFNDEDETLIFLDSDDNNVFHRSLCDFTSGRVTGIALLKLKDNGVAININPYDEGTTTSSFTVSCAFVGRGSADNISYMYQEGLVVCTPAEQDGKWRYSWRGTNSWSDPSAGMRVNAPYFTWIIDNGVHNVLIGVPSVRLWNVSQYVAINKVYLPEGFFSKYIYMQTMGNNQFPGLGFKLNGQKFISFFRDNNYAEQQGAYAQTPYSYRPPCFLLEDDAVLVNNSSSTKEYSSLTKYKEGDYCIYRGLLYVCLTDIDTPEEFDEDHWMITTVPNELLKN